MRRLTPRNLRRLKRKMQSAQVTPRELLLDVADPRVQRLLDDVTVVFTRAVPPTREWFERVNKNLQMFRLGGLLMNPIEGHPELVACTWGMTLRGKEAADIKWGVGLPPIPTATRKEIFEADKENPVSEFSQICTVVLSMPPESSHVEPAESPAP